MASSQGEVGDTATDSLAASTQTEYAAVGSSLNKGGELAFVDSALEAGQSETYPFACRASPSSKGPR